MQIHYIWVFNYGYLKEASINLSSRFIFEMAKTLSKEGNDILRLTIKKNPDYIHNFFDKDNVSNVSAIIGKNGSGKSSILKYIKSHLPSGLEAGVTNDIFAYSINEKDDDTLYLVKPDDLEIEINDQTGLFKNLQYSDLEHSLRFEGHLSDVDYIYYSYFLDLSEDLNNWGGLFNISTSMLLNSQRKRIMEDKNSDSAKIQLLSSASDLENLNLDEVARAIQFLGSKEYRKLPFERPKDLNIEINLFDSIYFEGGRTDKDVEELLAELLSRNKWQRPKEGLLNNLLMAILINFYIDERKYASNSLIRTTIALNEDEGVKDYILRFFKEIKNYTVNDEEGELSISKYKTLSLLVPQFLDFLDDLIEKKIIEIKNNQPNVMKLTLNDETEEIFKRFKDYYLSIKGISTFFNFRWRSLSTGEQSYLSFMSRFYHVKHHEHNSNKLKHDLVIMIDEGDACYHPEWQRKFFNTSLDFLSNLFNGHSIQLIFTANTPFLSSDLPKSHVLFIEKVGEQSSIFHSKDNGREDTFAANIHTLYSNSFYLDGILIGEFARNRIDKIILYLNNDEQKTAREDYKKTIEMIGEPILRRKLQNMWAEKFGLDEELVLLHKRIQEINEIKIMKKKGKRND